MKKIIYLVTGNLNKVEIAKHSLGAYDIAVEQLAIDTPEIQSSDTEEVAKYSVKYAAEKTGKPVIKGDFGMFIESLNGFPGPFVKFINKWLKADNFIQLYKNEKNKKAHFIDALGYCEPGKHPLCFTTNTKGILIETSRGENGNMVDSLFVPEGFNKTIAELSKEESLKLWNNDRYSKLAGFLNNKQ